MSARKRQGVRPTHDWELLLPLFEWPEQERYEEIRPLVLFDVAVAERAAEVGTSASTLYRRLDRFAEDGMEGLFDAPTAKRKRLPPSVTQIGLPQWAFLVAIAMAPMIPSGPKGLRSPRAVSTPPPNSERPAR